MDASWEMFVFGAANSINVNGIAQFLKERVAQCVKTEGVNYRGQCGQVSSQ
jgi:hypothetical protein